MTNIPVGYKQTGVSTIPNDLEIKKLGEIVNITKGKKVDFSDKGKKGYIDIGILRTNKIEQYTDDNGVECNNDDILIAWDGSKSGTVGYGLSGIIGSTLAKLEITKKDIYTPYIGEFLKSKFDYLNKYTSGAAIPHIRKEILTGIEIPLPPLETQKAIVAKLDQIFAELDQTKSEIQKNLDNTDELWKSALNQAFQGDWEMKKIKDIADIKSGKRLPKGNFVQDKKTDYPYIRVSDFGDDGTITVSTVKYITEEIHEQIKKYIITDKDLYVSIAGTIGKTGIIPSELNGANLTENAVRLVYNGKYEIDNRFILYFTNSKSFEVQAGLASRAVAMPKLAISRLENIELPVPPLSEQEKIVEHLDQVSKEVKALKSQYQSQLDNLEELKKSVLDKAFRGEI